MPDFDSLFIAAADPAFYTNLRAALTYYILLVLSIGLHEYGHAKAADLRGDFLPRSQGRVTLNPLAHVDPIGTGLIPLSMLLLPVFLGGPLGFGLIGWGKPVQVSLPNPRTRRADDLIITLAGPLMNVLIALFAALAGGLALRFLPEQGYMIRPLVGMTIGLNTMLIAFNLIPIPPLDGSRLLRHFVGMSEETFYRLAVNGWWILLLIINFGPTRNLLGQLADGVAIPFVVLLQLARGY